MIKRRRFLLWLGTSPLLAALQVRAQTPARLRRIGYLASATRDASTDIERGFLEGLRELGYVEGRNVAIERRYADGDMSRLPKLAGELTSLKVDVILTTSPPGTLAARKATATIPIVFAGMGDPVGNGPATSLSRPGGNATGLSTVNVELAAKRLQLLKEALPKATRVALLHDPGIQENIAYRDATIGAAKRLGLHIIPISAQRPEDYSAAFAAAAKNRADALLVVASPLLFSRREEISDRALRARLPTMFNRHEFVESRGLMTYSVDNVELFRRAAGYVDKILKGANPGELPIQQPVRFLYVVNLKTAKALGIKIPQSVLLRADRVIE